MRALHGIVGALVLHLVCACGDDAITPVDGGARADARMTFDGGGDLDGSTGGPALAALPILTPCPLGWREVAAADAADVPSCAPFAPDAPDAPEACPDGEALFPGAPGCAPVSVPCPADGWPADLPADGSVVYVRAGAASGDGTRALPLGTIGEALAVATPDATIAIATGDYDESLTIVRSVALRGACADTVLRGAAIGGTIAVFGDIDVSIRDLRVSGAGDGIWSDEARVEIARVIVDASPFLCLRNSRGGTVRGERLLLRGCTSGVVSQSATTELHQVEITGVRMEALSTVGTGALSVTDVTVRAPSGDATAILANGGTVDVVRGAFVSTSGDVALEVYAFGGSTVRIADSVVDGPPLDVESEPVTLLGLEPGVDMTLERVSLARLRGLGLAFTEPGTALHLRDVRMVDVASSGPMEGHGIEIGIGATLDAERLLVLRSHGYGILFDGAGTTGSLRDVTVSDTLSESNGYAGRGLQAQTGALVDVERARFRGNREVGVVAASPTTRLSLSDVIVSGTRERACVSSGCAEAGIGVGSYLSAAVDVTAFEVSDNHLIGLQIANDASLDLRSGRVSGHVVGVNIQVDGYDVTRLTDRVVYTDNDTNLDARSLPVPDPMAATTM